MSNPLGVDDFFALEAGEYLERLTALVADTKPAADELVRYARALRGSALMASQNAIARAAGGFEVLVRAYRDGKRSWDAAVAAAASNGVSELKSLVASIRRWTAADTTLAERLAQTLEAAAGVAPPPPPRSTPPPGEVPSEAGVRAFVAREGAQVASALDQAAHALRTAPTARDSIQAVLRRLQPLRGLAALADLPPLPELLEGTFGALSDLQNGVLAPSLARELFQAGAQAISRATRDVAQTGRPDPDAAETRRFADLLLSTRAPEAPVVPIESLFFDDGQPGMVRRGTVPVDAPVAGFPRVELVSRGEHLCQVAAELERAVSPTQRDLQLLSLSADLRTLATGLSTELANQLGAFGDYARDAIAGGRAARVPHEFAARLREGGELLRSWSEGAAEPALMEQLTRLARTMLLIGRGAPVRPSGPIVRPTPTPAPAPVVTPPAAELPIVPIESLAPDEPEPAAAAASPGPEPVSLAQSFDTYARLVGELGLGTPSLAALLKPRPYPAALVAPAAAVPIEVPAIAVPGPEVPLPAPVPPATPVEVEPEVVDIAELCYRGRAALQRAAQLKLELRTALGQQASVDPLMAELLDLVELALVED